MELDDSVSIRVAEWRTQMPQLDLTAGALIARIHRLAQVLESEQTQWLRVAGGSLRIAHLGDFDVIRALRRAGSPYRLTPGAISAAMFVSNAGLTGRLRRLEADGWIERIRSTSDGRSILVQLTATAVDELDDLIPDFYEFEADLTRGLSADDVLQLGELLNALLADRERKSESR
jgi:DNA-binding MarR family transcriptional regulator